MPTAGLGAGGEVELPLCVRASPSSAPQKGDPFSSCPVLQKLQGPAAASEAGAGCLQRHLPAQGQPAQKARAALLPGGHRGLGAGATEPGASRGVAEGTWHLHLLAHPPALPFPFPRPSFQPGGLQSLEEEALLWGRVAIRTQCLDGEG